MRILFLKDTLIADFAELERQFTDLYETHTGITPEYRVEPFDYSNVPTELDGDGDTKPTTAFIKEHTSKAFKRYHADIDHVIFLVHEDNWIFNGIWGTNWSNIYSGYQVELCRYDKDNIANSLGTLYHEVHHSHDALIKAMTGVDINPIVGVTSWDASVTHGGRDNGAVGWKYIRYKENTKSLELIAPYLSAAYQKRRELWSQEKRRLMEQIVILAQQLIVILAQQLIVFLRQKLNQKTT